MHPLGSIRPVKSRGTVSLVALCFVAVLGISLASYIAVCSRAMQLSNRSFQAGVSQQLAEAGIEEALRAFNQNNWDDWTSGGISVDWTLDTTNKRATATMTFPTGKFGQGTTASVKLRVDNYDANVVGIGWSSSKSYRVGDIVGRNGLWYRCVKNHSNQTPNNISSLGFWAPAPIPSTWLSTATYKQEDVVNYNETWYRYINGSSSSGFVPTNTTYWRAIPNIYGSYSGSTYYNLNEVVYYSPLNTWIICTSSGWGGNSWAYAAISWRWTSSKSYSYNDVVYEGGVWYRYINSSTTSGNPLSSTAHWENALSGSMHGWSSAGISYNLGDVAYYNSNGQWYRCIRAHTSSTSILPTNTTYWTTTPLYSPEWDSAKQYSQNDTVRYNGIWYLSLQNSNVAQNPETATSFWIGANTTNTNYTWNAASSYSASAYRCYGGVWYRCAAATTANAGHTPNNTTYWSAAWGNSWGVTTGAPVAYAEATVTLTGNPTQRTQLRATLAPAPLFPNAVAATSTLSGNSGGTVDSYDSSKGTYSSQVGTSTNYSAVLAAGSTITLSSTAVKGYLAWPSPPSGIGTSATVKGLSSSTSPNVDTSRVTRSPYIPQFTTLPGGLDGLTSNWSSTPKGTALPTSSASSVNIGTPGAVTPSRYYSTNLTVDGSNIPVLNINGPVVLYIQGDMTVQGTSSNLININSSGSAEIHIGDQLRINSGGAGISNKTLLARNCVVICDTTASSVQNYSDGDNDFYGVIYIPNTTNSNGFLVDNSSVVIYGAISASKVTYSGANMNLHYDTSLRYATIPGVDQPWTATEWRELPVTEQATMP